MKLLLVTDTHLGLNKSSDVWHDITLNLFREITDLCLSKNIEEILHLGDFFHEKKHTNQKSLDIAYEIAKIIEPLNMQIITGNHDIYYKDVISPSSLKCFKDTDNIKVITETIIMEDIVLIPWNGSWTPNIPHPWVFGHFAINDFAYNNTRICDDSDLNPSDFRQFKQVYSGHFHTPSNKGNINYLGSAFQQTFNDMNSSRGYYIWEDGELEFFEYKGAPKFIELHTEQEIKRNVIEGNIVRLVYDKDYGTNKNTKILEEIERLNPLKIKPDFTNIVMEGEEFISDDISILEHDDIVREWVNVNKVPENINKKVLLKIMTKMMEEE
jgi:DNA repair exonuclease SbcCD nuclease subunit